MARSTAFLICIFLFFSVIPSAFAFEDSDLQLWTTAGLESKLSDRWELKAEEEFRFGDDASIHYYNHTDAGLEFKVTDGLYLGGNYRQIYEKIEGEWKYECRPHVNATVKFDWAGFEISDRNRWEYRVREDRDDTARYRNKLTVGYPLKWDKFKVTPYLADEIFIDFGKGIFNRNRFYAGFKFNPFKHLKTDLFYLLQSNEKSNKWTGYNVLGLKMTVVF
jgi:hypothetical protein